MKKTNRCGSIDFWKFIFMMVIVVYHSIYLIATKYRWKHFSFLRGGYIGVEFFAIVSGFLMAASAAKLKDTELNADKIGVTTFGFLKRKLMVVFPYYITALVFNFAMLHINNFPGWWQTVKDAVNSLYGILLMRMTGVQAFYTIGPAWYVSAMLLAMLVLYPLLLRYKSAFTMIIAPAVALFGLGYLSSKIGHLAVSAPKFVPAMIRMYTELCIGCICFEICERFKKVELARWTKPVLTFLEVALLMLPVISAQYKFMTQFDFILIVMLSAGIIISFSGKSALHGILRGEWTAKLASFSAVLLFCHANVPALIRKFMPFLGSYMKMLPFYIVFSLILTTICKLLTDKVLIPAAAKLKKAILA